MNRHPNERAIHDLLDGDLPAAEAEALQAHLNRCLDCRTTVRAFETLRKEARALSPGVPPDRDLWSGIEARIREAEGAGTAREPRPLPLPAPPLRGSPRRGPVERRRGRPVGIPAGMGWTGLAAAGIAAVLGGALLFTTEREPPEAAPGASAGGGSPYGATGVAEVWAFEDAYRPAIQELEALADARELSPETRTILDENLALIDRAIEESRAAVAADPGAAEAIESLRRMYHAKIDVLRTVAVRN